MKTVYPLQTKFAGGIIINLVKNVARGGGCCESFKLFLSFTKRNWHQVFNLITLLFLYTNLFLFCEKKYIHIVILTVFIQIF